MASDQSESIHSINTEVPSQRESDSPKDVGSDILTLEDESVMFVTNENSDESKTVDIDDQVNDNGDGYSSEWTTEETSTSHVSKSKTKTYSLSLEEFGDDSSSRPKSNLTGPSSISDYGSTKDKDYRSQASDPSQHNSYASSSSTGGSDFSSAESKVPSYTGHYSDSFEDDTSDSSSADEETKAKSTFVKQSIKKFKSVKPDNAAVTSSAADKLHYNESEMTAAEKYCKQILDKLSSKSSMHSRTEYHPAFQMTSVHRAKWKQTRDRPASDCGVTPDVLSKFKLDNCLMRLHKETEQQRSHHERCADCMEKVATVEKHAFLKRKVNLVQNKVIEEKLSNVNAMPDTIMLLGELARDLPKLSDNPKDIMERLLLPLKSRSEPLNT